MTEQPRVNNIFTKGNPYAVEQESYEEIDTTPNRLAMDIEEEEPMGPHFNNTPNSPNRVDNIQTQSKENHKAEDKETNIDSESSEGEWITKEKKEKRLPRNMTQTKNLIQC